MVLSIVWVSANRSRAFVEIAAAQASNGDFSGALGAIEHIDDKLDRAEATVTASQSQSNQARVAVYSAMKRDTQQAANQANRARTYSSNWGGRRQLERSVVRSFTPTIGRWEFMVVVLSNELPPHQAFNP